MKVCKRIFMVILMFVMMTIFVTGESETVIAAKEDFEIEVEYGFENKIQVGCHVPIYITVTNNGDNFEGSVEVIVAESYYNTMHGKDISIAAGDTKTVVITAPFYVNAPRFAVRIVNKKDDIVYKEMVTADIIKSINTANIGVLTDDYTALSYMADQVIDSSENIYTRLYELSADRIPEEYKALDMLDVIVISNYSTDKLTKAQIDVIDKWVQDGGLLLLGTGTTVSKTFAGLNGVVFNASLGNGEFKTYSTKFGIESMIGIVNNNVSGYDYRDDYFFATSEEDQEYFLELIDKYEESWKKGYYENFFNQFYNDNYDKLVEIYKGIFIKDYYGGYLSDEEWKSYGENEFYHFMFELVDRIVELKLYTIAQDEQRELVEKIEYVNADVLSVTLKGTSGASFYAEIEGSDDEFELVSSIRKGEGQIAIAGIDFTQNPMASFAGNKFFFSTLINTFVGSELIKKQSEYMDIMHGYYYEWNEEEDYLRMLGDAISTHDIPPMIIYVVLLLFYTVGGLVIYFILRKKRKSMLYWGVQAGLAVLCAVIIYFAGFTTRKTKAEYNVAVVNLLEDGQEMRTVVGELFMPKKKSYEVAISNEFTSKLLADYGYYGYDLTNRDYDSYYLAEKATADAYVYEICNEQALGTQSFMMSNSIMSERTVDTKLEWVKNTFKGSVTNNYGVTLEDAILFYDSEFWLLGDIAPGETVKLEDAEVISDNYYYYNMEYIFGKQNYNLSKFLFGNSNEDKAEVMKRTFYRYVNDTVVNRSYYNAMIYDKGVYFFAFPTETDFSVLEGDGIKENVYEMVCKWIPFDEIEGIDY